MHAVVSWLYWFVLRLVGVCSNGSSENMQYMYIIYIFVYCNTSVNVILKRVACPNTYEQHVFSVCFTHWCQCMRKRSCTLSENNAIIRQPKCGLVLAWPTVQWCPNQYFCVHVHIIQYITPQCICIVGTHYVLVLWFNQFEVMANEHDQYMYIFVYCSTSANVILKSNGLSKHIRTTCFLCVFCTLMSMNAETIVHTFRKRMPPLDNPCAG